MYNKFASYYNEIFPLDLQEVNYLKDIIIPQYNNILELGCGTGELLHSVEPYIKKGVGVDFNKDMINEAKKYKNDIILFKNVDMTKYITKTNKIFNGIIIHGNTMPHISNFEVERLIFNCYKKLEKKGFISIQIINFDYIFQNNIRELPIINSNGYNIYRKYHYSNDFDKIDFTIDIKSKEFSKSFNTTLYPISKDFLIKVLNKAGFKKIKFFSSFNKNNNTNNRFRLICNARKNE